jgi:hypothetical protein
MCGCYQTALGFRLRRLLGKLLNIHVHTTTTYEIIDADGWGACRVQSPCIECDMVYDSVKDWIPSFVAAKIKNDILNQISFEQIDIKKLDPRKQEFFTLPQHISGEYLTTFPSSILRDKVKTKLS